MPGRGREGAEGRAEKGWEEIRCLCYFSKRRWRMPRSSLEPEPWQADQRTAIELCSDLEEEE